MEEVKITVLTETLIETIRIKAMLGAFISMILDDDEKKEFNVRAANLHRERIVDFLSKHSTLQDLFSDKDADFLNSSFGEDQSETDNSDS